MDKQLFVISSLALLPVAALFLAVTFFRTKKKLGEKRGAFRKKTSPLAFLIPPASIALILLCLIRDFQTTGMLAICGCGILGFYLSGREILIMIFSGIYEEGFIIGSDFFFFENISRIDCSQENLMTVESKTKEQKTIHVQKNDVVEIIAAAKKKNPSIEIS